MFRCLNRSKKRHTPTRMPYSCQLQFGTSGNSGTPVGAGNTWRAIGLPMSHTSRLTMVQNTLRAPVGGFRNDGGTVLRIVIVGAGIGGLAAALALLRDGHEVEIYEQAPTLEELGAGVQISANGARVLFALGLESAIRKVWCEPSAKEIRLWNTGETWKLFDLGAESVARYGAPYFMIHRADLHGALIDAVRSLAPDAIHLGVRCTGFDDDGSIVTIHLANGEHVTGDALIAADGVHSVVRK